MPRKGAFCVYETSNVGFSAVLATLNHRLLGDSDAGDQWRRSSLSFVNRPVSDIIRHHRSQPEPFNKRFFVVVNRADWKAEGVLVVNLVFEEYIDAARLRADVAGSAIPAVSTSGSDWTEALVEFVRRPRFAVYADARVERAVGAKKLLEDLNWGMGGRKETCVPVCALVPNYLAPDNIVIEQIVNDHRSIAGKEQFDPEFFIIADEENVDDHGVIMARVLAGGKVDCCRRPVDVVAEVLTWVKVGLYSWQEAKVWDDEPR